MSQETPVPTSEYPRIRITGGPQGFDTKVEVFATDGSPIALPVHAVTFSGGCQAGRALNVVTLTLAAELEIDLEAAITWPQPAGGTPIEPTEG